MLKTASFAAMHVCVAFVVVGLLTGNWWAGGLVALVEPMCNTVAYHVHERLWERTRHRRPATHHAPGWPAHAHAPQSQPLR